MPTTADRDKLIEILNGSAYGAHVLAKPVVDWPSLTGCLLKEATPQAWHGAKKSFRRVKGSTLWASSAEIGSSCRTT